VTEHYSEDTSYCVLKYKNCKKTGKHKCYYQNKQLKSQEKFWRGYKTGTLKHYYPNEKLARKGKYRITLHSPIRSWFWNKHAKSRRGTAIGCGHHRGKAKKENFRERTWKDFDSTGLLLESTKYNYGLRRGYQKEYKDGILIKESKFKFGVRHGVSKTYNLQGVIISKNKYKKDLLIHSVNYYSNGNIKSTLQYFYYKPSLTIHSNKLDGKQLYYSKKGQLERIEFYKEGKLINSTPK
jgi:antitoxin component YwqK of YwqJK toxin-antitoxin module